jgi:hypothetical protein
VVEDTGEQTRPRELIAKNLTAARTGRPWDAMSAAEKIAPSMAESLAWKEICRRFPDEWVCLVEIQHEADGSLRSAQLISHHRSAKAALQLCSWSTNPLVVCAHTGGRKLRSPRIEMTDENRDIFRPRR